MLSYCWHRTTSPIRPDRHNLFLLLFMALELSAFLSPVLSSESRFIVLPESTTIKDGSAVTFKCEATSRDNLLYSWTHNGNSIVNTKRIYQIGSNLHITRTNRTTDVGDYVCIATSSISGAREAAPPAHLDFIWIASATVQLQPVLEKHKNDVILKCHVDSSGDTIRIEWFRNGEKLDKSTMDNANSNRYEFLKRKLHIKKATAADNGVYRCVAHNEAGSVVSKRNYVLKIIDSRYPEIVTDPENKIVEEGKTASFRCSYRNSDDIEWIRRNNLLQNGESVRIDKNGTLLIKNIRHDDNGVYLCRGKRGDKVQEFSNELSVMSQTKPQKQPNWIVVNENEPTILACDVVQKGKSPGSIRWRKDGKPFRSLDISIETSTYSMSELSGDVSIMREDPRVYIAKNNGSLIFMQSVATDEGTYDCQIVTPSNEILASGKSHELQVIEILKFVPQPTSKNLELGAIGKLHCKAQGTPSPQVKWIKEGNAIDESIDDINGTLIFRNVTAEHSGNYTCMANNSQGSITATVTISVVMSPRFSVPPEGPVQAIEMGSAMFHCQAIGDPRPTIQWDKDLQYLNKNNSDDSRFQILDNGTLHILEVHLDDEGKYGCTIGNSAGLKREEVRLVVKPAEGFVTEESSDGFMITKAVLITMSVAFAYIVLVVGLMLWCRYKRQARKARLTAAGNKENGADTTDVENKNGEIEPCLPDKSKGKSKKANGTANHVTTDQKSDDASSANSKTSKKSSSEFDQIAISRSSLTDLAQVGRGEFGDVFIGKIKAIDIKMSVTKPSNSKEESSKVTTENEKRRSRTSIEECNEIKVDDPADTNDTYKLVLVKALNKVKDENICMEFRRQIDLFRTVSYKSVSKLYGLCRDKDPHYMVLEYTDWGDFKQFLMASSDSANTDAVKNETKIPPLNIPQILTLAHQIARGMDAIYRARFIHKDLATRNCIISSNFTAKISYPALSKDKYSREYFKHRNQLIPLRWLAPECLQEDDYSTKSDIYAYGVLVWEIFTQATKLPFETEIVSNDEFLTLLQTNKLEWKLAEQTPDSLKAILKTCWSKNPKDRPSFSQLAAALVNSLKTEYPKDKDKDKENAIKVNIKENNFADDDK